MVRELKRAAFTFSRSSYNELLTTIKDGVTNLESLTTGNIDHEPKRRVRSHVRFLSVLRGVSASLYRAVSSSLACACKHRVLMRLSVWPADITPDHAEDDIIHDLKFRLALSSDSVRGPSEPQGQLMENLQNMSWEEILLEANTARKRSGQVTADASAVLSRAVSDCSPGTVKKRRKVVNFASLRPSSTISTTTRTPGAAATDPPTAVVVPGEETLISTVMSKMTIEVASVALSRFGSTLNLCHQLGKVSVSTTQQRVDCYGIVFDPKPENPQETRSYTVYPVPDLSPDKSQGCKVVSLRDVLQGKDGLTPLGYRHRLQLAVFIARSILQFYKTPWMPLMPSSQNFFFIQRGSSTFSYYDHAFLMAVDDNSTSSEDEAASAIPLIRNPTLMALGVLLVELVTNRTVDSMRRPEEVVGGGKHNLLSDYMTTRRLLKDVHERSSNFGSAVRRCIDCEFRTAKLDLEDEDFRQEVYSRVVALLEEDLGNV